MSYNGWKNYETWSVALIIDNDEGSYNYTRERMREIADEHAEDEPDSYPSARSEFADWLKEYVEEFHIPELPEHAYLASQLLSAAMSEVDWYEIAENWLTEID